MSWIKGESELRALMTKAFLHLYSEPLTQLKGINLGGFSPKDPATLKFTPHLTYPSEQQLSNMSVTSRTAMAELFQGGQRAEQSSRLKVQRSKETLIRAYTEQVCLRICRYLMEGICQIRLISGFSGREIAALVHHCEGSLEQSVSMFPSVAWPHS